MVARKQRVPNDQEDETPGRQIGPVVLMLVLMGVSLLAWASRNI